MPDSQDPLQDLWDEYDELDSQPESQPTTRSSSTSRNYRSALGEARTDVGKAARATGKRSTVAGQYLRRSFTYRPDQIENIDQLATHLNLSKNDLVRWFVDMGIEAVMNGATPPIYEEVRHRYSPRFE